MSVPEAPPLSREDAIGALMLRHIDAQVRTPDPDIAAAQAEQAARAASTVSDAAEPPAGTPRAHVSAPPTAQQPPTQPPAQDDEPARQRAELERQYQQIQERERADQQRQADEQAAAAQVQQALAELRGSDEEYARLLEARIAGEFIAPDEEERFLGWHRIRQAEGPFVARAQAQGQAEGHQAVLNALAQAAQRTIERPWIDREIVQKNPDFGAIFNHFIEATEAAVRAEYARDRERLETLEVENRGLRAQLLGRQPAPERGGQTLAPPRGPAPPPQDASPRQLIAAGLQELTAARNRR